MRIEKREKRGYVNSLLGKKKREKDMRKREV